MSGANKTLVVIFSGALVFLAFITFHLFDGFSQRNVQSPANAAVMTNGSTVSNAAAPPVNNEFSGGAVSLRDTDRNALCASGFVEIPPEFKEVFLKHTETRKVELNELKELYKLKNEVNFHAFTFPSETESYSADGYLECKIAAPKPDEIKFVSQKVDDLLAQFISAIIFNETEVISARKAAENGNDPGKIQFCHEIECGTEDPSAQKTTLGFSNQASLEANYKYATSILIINAKNELRKVLITNSRERELVDDEIDQILAVAIKVEIANARK